MGASLWADGCGARAGRGAAHAVCHGARASRFRQRLWVTVLDAGETPAPLRGRVLRSNTQFAAFSRLLPLIPLPPSPTRGEGGVWAS